MGVGTALDLATHFALGVLGIVALVLLLRWVCACLDRLIDKACACYFDDGERQ